MNDLKLRFPDAAPWLALELEPDDTLAIDVVGTVYENTGSVDADGQPVLAPIEGYHVNVRCEDDRDLSALSEYVVTPQRPFRVWA